MISTWDCFRLATLELVRSTPIKQRLVSAYRRNLSLVQEDQLPDDVRETVGQVMRSMRGVQPLAGEDAVAASVRKMSSQEADECAALIVEIFAALSRGQQVAPANPKGSVVQLHSVDRAPADYAAPALMANN
jgi:hypothetical protein